MRRFMMRWITTFSVIIAMGCAPEALFPEGASVTDALDAVVTASADPTGDGDLWPDSSGEASSSGTSSSGSTTKQFNGTVSGAGEYQLIDLGSGRRGDQWSINSTNPFNGAFIVVLFDANQNLLMRTYMTFTSPLRHTLRENTGRVLLGIMPPSTGNGGNFSLRAAREPGQTVTAAAPQVVWLNFDGGTGVRVHNRDPISFSPFDGVMVGDAYDGHTAELKNVILREMRADYASHNVTILSSDDGPPPDGAHSVVHFGGGASGLLGLADNVDNYNQDPAQDAIIYVENFAPYWTMKLEPDEMAVMIANVGSHELGHLLGLYHTQDPADVMDTTGTAWELAENQSFIRGRLESTVFATGWEDSPALLSQIVGDRPDEAAKAVARQKSPKAAIYKAIRDFAREETTAACGTCLCLDHE